MSFNVAIIGRPNVGKSTLYNRLTGTHHALVDDQPGVTRDWKKGEGSIGPMTFKLLDTAGLEDAGKNSLERRMFQQTEAALEQADVVLFMFDARSGITTEDERFARWLRQSGKKVIPVANKAEGGHAQIAVNEAYALGLGEAVGISAAHGEGMQDLYAALEPFWMEAESRERAAALSADTGIHSPDIPDDEFSGFDPDAEVEIDESKPVQIAIIGRPNAGKSTLFNRLLGADRTLTGPEAGITRDAIAEDITHKGRFIKLVDTAGMRRKANIHEALEKLAVSDALRVIQYAHVVVMLVDAEIALEKQDLNLLALVEREGRAVMIGVNKWDKIPQEQRAEYMDVTHRRLNAVVPQLKGLPVVPLSAETGERVDKLLDAALDLYRLWHQRLPTGQLNRWLDACLQQHSPPIVKGRRVKIRYATQIKTRPPTVALFVNNTVNFPESYKRYLVNALRQAFNLPGVPIRMLLRKGSNPYAEKKK